MLFIPDGFFFDVHCLPLFFRVLMRTIIQFMLIGFKSNLIICIYPYILFLNNLAILKYEITREINYIIIRVEMYVLFFYQICVNLFEISRQEL